ncbi:UxaA family hydrolase [Alicyclobacillus tolerans]|uniref:UxaA family hydrolase n=1 Tax=Alicyclobacillus tolerans TaxID=90970 RepID=UPI0035580E4B|nr:UxaA family hydrolase [Alicyclobacillus tolerans]
MSANDNVGVAIVPLHAGATYTAGSLERDAFQVQVMEDIPEGHKLALVQIENKAVIRKYGEVIGRATEQILLGQHVHDHNLTSIRGGKL